MACVADVLVAVRRDAAVMEFDAIHRLDADAVVHIAVGHEDNVARYGAAVARLQIHVVLPYAGGRAEARTPQHTEVVISRA